MLMTNKLEIKPTAVGGGGEVSSVCIDQAFLSKSIRLRQYKVYGSLSILEGFF